MKPGQRAGPVTERGTPRGGAGLMGGKTAGV